MQEKRKRKIFIIHFQPIEQYPPIMNFLRFAEGCTDEFHFTLVTTNSYKGLANYIPAEGKLDMHRIAQFSRPNISGFKRLLGYLNFYSKCFYLTLKAKPDVILYYESLSAMPAIFYKYIFRRKALLFAHYHEYTSLADYRSGMVINRFSHWLEKKRYRSYTWISHTNELRLAKFREDHQLKENNVVIFETLPNYPSDRWQSVPHVNRQKPYRLVMLGAVEFDNMYVQEVIEWVAANPAEVCLDFIAYNVDQQSKDCLQKFPSPNIRILPGINYEDISKVLPAYDIGLVMYKPYSYNMVHSTPNKIYEYLICGLDVWIPNNMTGALHMATVDAYPKIIPVDYTRLDQLNVSSMAGREGLSYKSSQYYYENVYSRLFDVIKQKLES